MASLTARLELIPKTREEVLGDISRMSAADKAQLSADWLARIEAPDVDQWTLGYSLALQSSGTLIGSCGFKGPPDAEGVVEIAYGISPEHRNNGYATEAANALVTFASLAVKVTVIRAHTLDRISASTRVLTKCGFEMVRAVHDPEDGWVWRWERAARASLGR
jgi:[ribosomal protein S5]-alanine N-acetyltransferase